MLKQKESFFLTRGYFTAEFLRAEGMKFVKPTGCPSLFFAPNEMRRSLTSLANADLASAQKLALGGYLGSVADTIVDAHALLKPDSVASYVIQDEVVAYNLTLPVDDNDPVYDRSSGRITGKTEYKHQEKWQRENELMVFFDTNQWRAWASSMDFNFGRRFHGSIIAMQAAVPSLMVAVDDRMREMLGFTGLPAVDVTEIDKAENRAEFVADHLAKLNTTELVDRYSDRERAFRTTLREIGIAN